MKKLAIIASLLAMSSANAQVDSSKLTNQAIAADLGTTAIGLSLGASEANPLGLVVVPLKFLLRDQIKKIPDENQRREVNARFTGMQFGAASANVCILVIGNPVISFACFATGALYGYHQVRSVSTETDCINKHLPDFQKAIETGRVYRILIKTCEGHFEDLEKPKAVDQPTTKVPADKTDSQVHETSEDHDYPNP